ncbi:SEC-C metal-binding domain-containing protein [Brevibacillus daliensis]|uniref:SEC-C metal-binding domain-containing protein n=1 Tax=Brevibacillus daliensis TaxID=2892995 RepID=UPI001E464681|nr:SEC-C metal-binding domain-containing protein [Brevibacillus daliensis]
MSVGRNQLCPCGSGKKYKKCCGVVTNIADVRIAKEQKLRKDFAAWTERLTKFVIQQVNDEEISRARDRFATQTGLPLQELFQPLWTDHFMNWYVLDVKHEGVTILEKFIGQYGRRMEQEIKDGMSHLQFRLYEITFVKEDTTTVIDVLTGEEHQVTTAQAVTFTPGQLFLGRLLSLGYRSSIFSGSLMIGASLKESITRIMQAFDKEQEEELILAVYRRLNEQGIGYEEETDEEQENLMRYVYRNFDAKALEHALKSNVCFESKKQDATTEVWVYAAHKEEFLIRSLDNTLLELHNVAAEIIVNKDLLFIEGLLPSIEKVVEILQLGEPTEENSIQALTSTGTKLAEGTLFITSAPMLPPRILQWAIQSYFTEQWLQNPQQELHDLPPLLIAASDKAELKAELAQTLDKLDKEMQMGQGVARFLHVEEMKAQLCYPNKSLHISNLLQRPLIEGLPESIFTVGREVLEDIAIFVNEMTTGKSELTVKKYDESMNLLRTFVRNSFGPSFTWSDLKKEYVAYFLAHDILKRVDSPSKTLATNILSVLSAFFKWLDKKYDTGLVAEIQPLLGELKESLPEAYRMRMVLQKEAYSNLQLSSIQPRDVVEEVLLVVGKDGQGYQVQRRNGDTLTFITEQELVLDANWSLRAILGEASEGTWRLYNSPECYPPAVTQLLSETELVEA